MPGVSRTPTRFLRCSSRSCCTSVVRGPGWLVTLLGLFLPAPTERWRMSDVVAGSLFTAQFLSAMTATLAAPAWAGIGARGALALGFAFRATARHYLLRCAHAIRVSPTVVYGLGTLFVLPLTNIAVAAAQPERPRARSAWLTRPGASGAVIAHRRRLLGSVEAWPPRHRPWRWVRGHGTCRLRCTGSAARCPRSTDGADHGGGESSASTTVREGGVSFRHLPPHATMARSGWSVASAS